MIVTLESNNTKSGPGNPLPIKRPLWYLGVVNLEVLYYVFESHSNMYYFTSLQLRTIQTFIILAHMH